MARRQKSNITGRDKSYTSHFGNEFTPIPTNMPDSERAVENPQVQRIAPVQKPLTEKKTSKEKSGLKRSRKRSGEPIVSQPKSARKTKKTVADNRPVYFSVAPKATHARKLEQLKTANLDPADVIKLAGRAALAAFVPSNRFMPVPETDRLGKAFRYKTTKHVSVTLLEKLHDDADPLRLRSDAAMLRGQFEPLFWSSLEDVIEVLTGKYG